MLESGCRIHKSTFDWPKAHFPSSFTMKLRKHIRQKRLESVTQLGVDRIIDMQFGSDEHACHVVCYDRIELVILTISCLMSHQIGAAEMLISIILKKYRPFNQHGKFSLRRDRMIMTRNVMFKNVLLISNETVEFFYLII